jgi:hypothetical protein
MNWFIINWYIVVAIVSALLLGWGIGVWYGSSKGYAAAAQELHQLTVQKTLENYLKQFQGGQNGK